MSIGTPSSEHALESAVAKFPEDEATTPLRRPNSVRSNIALSAPCSLNEPVLFSPSFLIRTPPGNWYTGVIV